MRHGWPIVMILTLAVVLPSRVSAQTATEQNREMARSLVRQATGLYERREYRQAQELIEAAYRLFPNDKIQYGLGRVHEGQKHWLEAMLAYQRFLATVPDAERPPKQTEDATAAVTRIAPRLARVLFQAEDGTWFQVDDRPRLETPAETQWVEPGRHEIFFAEGRKMITVKEGETAMVSPSRRKVAVSPASGTSPEARPAIERQTKSRPEIDLAATLPMAADEAEEMRAAQEQVQASPITVATPHSSMMKIEKIPSAHRSNGLRAAKWLMLTVGVLGVAAGATLWRLDGLQVCNRAVPEEECPSIFSGRTPGIGLVAGGLAALGTSGILFGLDYRASNQGTRAAMLSVGGRL